MNDIMMARAKEDLRTARDKLNDLVESLVMKDGIEVHIVSMAIADILADSVCAAKISKHVAIGDALTVRFQNKITDQALERFRDANP